MKVYAHLEADDLTVSLTLQSTTNENEQTITNKVVDQINLKYQLNLKPEEISLYSDNESTKPFAIKSLGNGSDIYIVRKSVAKVLEC
jgi:hypothetical protein